MSRGYENPTTVCYSFPALAFGGTGSTSTIRSPRGLVQGNIRDIHAAVTVLFTAVTTPAYVRLGYSGTAAYFAELSMGTAAASAGYNLRDAGTISRKIDLVNDATSGALSGVLVTFVAATGGTPAGTATVTVVIDWF